MKKKQPHTLLTALVVAACVAFGISSATSETPHDADAPALTMDSSVEVMLLRIGIDQEVLAAAGLNGAAVQSALAAEEADLEAAVVTLASHDAAVADARRETDALRRKVKSGLATDEEVSQLATAKATLETATAAREAFLDGVCVGLCGEVSDGATTTINTVLSTPDWVKKLPVEYRNAERTDAEWLAIRDALASKKTHEQMGFEVPEEATSYLATLSADGNVSTTKTTCETNIASVQSTWNAVFSE